MSPRYCPDPTGVVQNRGGPMVRCHTSSFDGSEQPYAIYVPQSYTPERKWPLVISLHGYSSDHVLNLRRVFGMGNKPGEDGEECKKHFPPYPEVPFIVASPYGFGSVGYAAMGEVDALDVLADVKRLYSIDEDRVYLTGLSMGGEGTWHLGLRYPHLWAAIAPVCAPTGTFIGPEEVSLFVENALHTPALVTHGAADPVVPVKRSREMVALMKRFGYRVDYEEYPDVQHNAWDYTYDCARIFEWFAQFRRVRKPSRVVYVTDCLRYSKAYWLEITRISDWAARARIEAQVADDNSVDVSADNIAAFSLDLAEAPLDFDQPVVVRCAGSQVYSGPIPPNGRATIELSPSPSGRPIKRKGLEGPVYDAFRSRFAIVRATAGGSAVVNAVREAAEQVACWTDWADIEIPIYPDVSLPDAVVRDSNLVLIGDDRTNAVIGRINDRLPARFSEDGVHVGEKRLSGDLGFVEVYPNPLNPERYAVIIGARSAQMLAKALEVYRNVPDCAVFDSSTDLADSTTYQAYGYFDESWQIGAAR